MFHINTHPAIFAEHKPELLAWLMSLDWLQHNRAGTAALPRGDKLSSELEINYPDVNEFIAMQLIGLRPGLVQDGVRFGELSQWPKNL